MKNDIKRPNLHAELFSVVGNSQEPLTSCKPSLHVKRARAKFSFEFCIENQKNITNLLEKINNSEETMFAATCDKSILTEASINTNNYGSKIKALINIDYFSPKNKHIPGTIYKDHDLNFMDINIVDDQYRKIFRYIIDIILPQPIKFHN